MRIGISTDVTLAAGEVDEGLARCNRGLDRLGAASEERWQQSYLLALKGFCLLLQGELAQSGQAFCTAGYALADIVQFAAEGADELPPHPKHQPLPAPGGAAPGGAAPGGAAGLTNREWEIAGLVSEGLSNREIAGRLVISKRTVDAHIEHIYGKLGVSSRVQLASWLRSVRP
jgi:DNA-binding CsgD family transcriptional regulator